MKLRNLIYEGVNDGGDCYFVAGKFMLDNVGWTDDDYKLVHGMVDGQGEIKGYRFGHAWIEYKNAIVIDNSNGHHVQVGKNVYYMFGHVDRKECKYYTQLEAMKWMNKTGNYGPWEMSGDTIKLTEDIPEETNEIGRKNIKIPYSVLQKIKELL